MVQLVAYALLLLASLPLVFTDLLYQVLPQIPIDNDFILRQKRVLSLLEHITQVNVNAEYYKIGKDFNIEANIEGYNSKKAVEEFLLYYRHGYLPPGQEFSIFNKQMRKEAIALYNLFYSASTFDIFYKTAAWARVFLNRDLFAYSFEIAVRQRTDTTGIVLLAPYEINPFFFLTSNIISKMHKIKMQNTAYSDDLADVEQQGNVFTINASYFNWQSYDNEERRLSYFTEDIGMNSYYWNFHATMPFWISNDSNSTHIQKRRIQYNIGFYQKLLARYYMERLSNSLGEIPQLSWRRPIITGYNPKLVSHRLTPFMARNNYYQIDNEQNVEKLENLKFLENQFLDNLKSDQFLDKTGSKRYEQYYEIIARSLLGAAPQPNDKYSYTPVVLEQYQTALRDPVFFQLYKRIMFYVLQYKQYLQPYTSESLALPSVKINDVKVEPLITFFENYTFNATNAVAFSFEDEVNNVIRRPSKEFQVRLPRLNHEAFTIEFDIQAENSSNITIRIFLGPKDSRPQSQLNISRSYIYKKANRKKRSILADGRLNDSNGYPISMEDNWMNFFELDSFNQKLTAGDNNIVRHSKEFIYFKDDSVSTAELYSYLDQGKVPVDQSNKFFLLPRRLMLPRGKKGGFPVQMLVLMYPFTTRAVSDGPFEKFFVDEKPWGYPLDRPVNELSLNEHNVFFKDVVIHHEGKENI